MLERIAGYARHIVFLGAVCIAVALGAWLVVGSAQTWIEVLGIVGLALVVASVLLRPSDVKAALLGRRVRYGSNAVFMSLAFLVIVGLVNYLGARHFKRWDVTAEKQFSISEQTMQILRSLKEPVHVKLFFTPAQYNRQKAEDMIKEYALRSDKLTYEFIDPDAQRRQAIDYQIVRDGTIVFERGSRREQTFGVQEQDLTGALLKVTRDKVKTVYFLTGHQERDPESADQNGYSLVRQDLMRENYKVERFNLAGAETPPEDAAALVIAGPRNPLAPLERERLNKYIEQGGRVLFLIEAGMPDPLEGMLRAYGLELPDALIIDPARAFFGDIASPLIDRFEFHQITKDLTGLSSFFPTARPLIKAEPQPEAWDVQILGNTSQNSWAETNYREKQVKPDDTEVKGPLALMAVIEPKDRSAGKGRLVVIGDTNFAENLVLQTVQGVGNLDLFMNAVNWLAEEEDLISIRPKQTELRQVILTPPQARTIIYSNILFLPLLVLLAGFVVWWRRR